MVRHLLRTQTLRNMHWGFESLSRRRNMETVSLLNSEIGKEKKIEEYYYKKNGQVSKSVKEAVCKTVT